MTFTEFQATGTDEGDLGLRLADEGLMGMSGRVYLDQLYIESTAEWDQDFRGRGKWALLLGNAQWQDDDLVYLEHRLYEFACSEGFCMADADSLTAVDRVKAERSPRVLRPAGDEALTVGTFILAAEPLPDFIQRCRDAAEGKWGKGVKWTAEFPEDGTVILRKSR